MEYKGLAVKLKQQMNDIIDVAFRERSEAQIRQFKRFTISCIDKEFKSRNGDCRCMPDKSSQIRIVKLESAPYRAILLTTMHEVSHHIDFSMSGEVGHGPEFYKVHLALLFAAFDMGILSKEDVLNSGSTSRSLNRVIIKRKMLDSYVPHPTDYKQDVAQIFVYNAYAVKDVLKSRGYKWNSLDMSWVLETNSNAINEEHDHLLNLGVQKENIKTINGSAVISRLRKNVNLYNVPYDKKDIVKSLGYRWTDTGKKKYWQRKIDGDSLPADERSVLEGIVGIRIVIS